MTEKTATKRIAKASVRHRLWVQLGLGPHDGTSFREPGDDGDVIVLSLRPSLVARFRHVTRFEGFAVDVRPSTPFPAYRE